jgi:hypothetical protein
MDFLLLGRELPTLELRVAAGQPPLLRCTQSALVPLRKGWHGRLETLRWLDVLLEDVEAETLYTAYYMGIQRFADLIGKEYPIQLTFFERFVKWQEARFTMPGRCTLDFEDLLQEPALLPFVWLNWVPGTLPATPSAPTAPFRVDFVLIVENRRLVIALDDLTDFMDYELDPHWRGVGRRLCPERFTRHLRQDRWLRRDNWEVFRFSCQEVETERINVLIADLGLRGDEG